LERTQEDTLCNDLAIFLLLNDPAEQRRDRQSFREQILVECEPFLLSDREEESEEDVRERGVQYNEK
jgi:hypothetical protein